MDHNESHFIDNIVFSDQEYFHNNLGEFFLCFTYRVNQFEQHK